MGGKRGPKAAKIAPVEAPKAKKAKIAAAPPAPVEKAMKKVTAMKTVKVIEWDETARNEIFKAIDEKYANEQVKSYILPQIDQVFGIFKEDRHEFMVRGTEMIGEVLTSIKTELAETTKSEEAFMDTAPETEKEKEDVIADWETKISQTKTDIEAATITFDEAKKAAAEADKFLETKTFAKSEFEVTFETTEATFTTAKDQFAGIFETVKTQGLESFTKKTEKTKAIKELDAFVKLTCGADYGSMKPTLETAFKGTEEARGAFDKIIVDNIIQHATKFIEDLETKLAEKDTTLEKADAEIKEATEDKESKDGAFETATQTLDDFKSTLKNSEKELKKSKKDLEDFKTEYGFKETAIAEAKDAETEFAQVLEQYEKLMSWTGIVEEKETSADELKSQSASASGWVDENAMEVVEGSSSSSSSSSSAEAVVEEAAPVVEEAPVEPVVEEEAMAIEEEAPVEPVVEGEPIQVVEEAAPVVEEAAPIVEEPVVEEAAPVVEEAAPVVEEAAPVVEEPLPEVVAPVEPVAAPAVQEFVDPNAAYNQQYQQNQYYNQQQYNRQWNYHKW